MLLVVVVLGLTLAGRSGGESSQEEEEARSKANKAFLKSRTATQELSFSSSFGSEDFDTPNIPDDFHARYGINKTWGVRTPHPLISHRASYEDYGRQVRVDSADGEIDTSELFSKTVENPWDEQDETSRGPAGATHTTVTEHAAVTARPSRNGKEKREVAPPSGEQSEVRAAQQTTAKATVSAAADSPPGPVFSSPTVATSRLRTSAWGPAMPKMDKYKRRRGDVIVLKPPPEDWPEPQPLDSNMEAGEVVGTIPPMGTHIDTRLGHKAKEATGGLGSPSFKGHRKIDFVPLYDKTTQSAVVEDGPFTQPMTGPTAMTGVKWRIRGRVRGGRGGESPWSQRGRTFMNNGMQDPANIRRTLTMKPSISKFFIAENSTFPYPTPSGIGARPYQRSYFNFRKRPPVNVGRSFGPPFEPGPPPPPRFMPNHPYNQPPYPQFPGYPHQFAPPPPQFVPPPYGPPPPPPFGQGMSPHFQGVPPPPRDQFSGPHIPQPPPPSPYPTGFSLPSVRPFLENIPTVNPIDGGPAPWPRRPLNWDYRRQTVPQPRVPDFLKQEPRNFSGYKGPRRGRGYEQYGKADLRPRPVKFYDEFAAKVTPKFPSRKGSGFGVEFQTDITRPPYVPGELFVKKTWPTRGNRYGYEPYRRTSDRRRPYGGFHRYAAEHPPVLGDFNDFKPYKRMDETNYVPFNYSRPTRSFTFPPRLSMAIRNVTMQRRYGQRSAFRHRDYNLPTLPSIGLEAYMAHKYDYYGNLVTPKGRIMNLQELRKLFTAPPAPAPIDVVEIDVSAPTAAPTVIIKPRLTAKPKGMTAREALRAAAREAIREAEMEDWEEGRISRRRKGWRGLGGTGGRGGEVVRRGGARGSGRRPRGPMNFRRAKRSVEEEAELVRKRKIFREEMFKFGDYLTGPGAHSSSDSKDSKKGPRSRPDAPPLRMRRGRPRSIRRG